MRLKKTAKQLYLELWQPLVGYSSMFLIVLAIFIYKIKYLVPGFSMFEKKAIYASSSGTLLMDNPLYAPHKILQYGLQKLGREGFIAMRSVSVFIAIGLVFLLFYTVKRWFSLRVAIITTALFALSSWLLFNTRSGTPDIMLVTIIGAIAYGAWLPHSTTSKTAIIVGMLLTCWLLYIPGLVWFVVLGILWQRNTIKELFTEEKLTFLIAGVGAVALLAPLFFAIYNDPGVLKSFIGLSNTPLAQLSQIPKNLLLVPYQLIVGSLLGPTQGINKVPLLDILTVAMAVIGGYYYIKNDRTLDRTKVIFGGALLGWILISLGGAVGIQILLPFVYLFVAGGFAFMIEQWFKVFPSNPFAKATATTLIVISVISVGAYHMHKYFIAWPQTPITRATFNQPPK